MRKRVLSLRLSETEFQSIKAVADRDGASVPIMARRLAMDALELGGRLAAIEAALAALPDRVMLVEIAQRLGARIDRAAGKGTTP